MSKYIPQILAFAKSWTSAEQVTTSSTWARSCRITSKTGNSAAYIRFDNTTWTANNAIPIVADESISFDHEMDLSDMYITWADSDVFIIDYYPTGSYTYAQ